MSLSFEFLGKNRVSEFMNLGSGEGFTVMEVLVASNKKAKELLGWRMELSDLETIIKTTWEWLKRYYSV